MAEDQAIDVAGAEQPFFIETGYGIPLAGAPVVVSALVQTAVEQDTEMIVKGDEVAGTRDFLRGAAKFDFHD